MGDGNVRNQRSHPSFRCNMINREFLEYLDELFGTLSAGITTEYEEFGNRGACYSWKTYTHPSLQRFADWYISGQKVFPKHIDLNSTVLKMWYVCDGHYKTSGSNTQFTLAATNEMQNKEKIHSYFEEKGLPSPSYWNNHNICWNLSESREIFSYIGKPLPGFEYKWPVEFGGTGQEIF